MNEALNNLAAKQMPWFGIVFKEAVKIWLHKADKNTIFFA